MKKWKCTVCSYIHTGEEPPDKCPVCGADKSLFTLLSEEEEQSFPQPSSPAPADVTAAPIAGRWRCTVCGYIHQGNEPPDKCPVCGADKSLFVPVEDSEPAQDAPHREESSTKEDPEISPQNPPGPQTIFQRLQQLLGQPPYHDFTQRLTLLHSHPITVHIPNGVLPIAVIFMLAAMIFRSEGLAIAARYNIYMVALAMPLVIATGLIDWINSFKGRMTRVFKIKMICAAIVTLLSVIIAIWWLADPDIYRNGLFANFIFVIFNLGNLAAAIVAGWYGGKLVFRK